MCNIYDENLKACQKKKVYNCCISNEMAYSDVISSILPPFSDLPDTMQYIIIGVIILFFLFILWVLCKIKDCFMCVYSIFKCLFCCCGSKGYKEIEK